MSNPLIDRILLSNNIAITGHISPDGDCVGSVLAIYNYIKKNYNDKKVKVFLQKPSEKFSYLSGYENLDDSLLKTDDIDFDINYDLCICLDAADDKRLGKNIKLVELAKDSIAIDHHISHKKYTKELILDANASSSCEVLSRYLDINKIDKDIATCLYTGLVHDTGVFKYPCTGLGTMELAGKLMEKGVEFAKIIDESFFARKFNVNKVLARALLDANLYLDNKLIISYTESKTLKEYGAEIENLDGIIDELRNTTGVEVAIYLYEKSEDIYKASLRSKKYVDVSKICIELGGGGHIRAAGCTLEGKLSDIINLLINKVKEQLCLME